MSHNAVTPTLSDRQEVILSVLLVISSSLSALGSSLIIYKVMRNRGVASPYDRLMLGLSTADLIASTGFGIAPFSAPKETSTRVWSAGNQTSCSFLGFVTQLGVAAVLYNGILSFYFLLTIRYKVPLHVFAKNYERWLHGIIIGFSTITASAGAFFGVYSELEVGMGCWVHDYPAGCSSKQECLSDDISLVFALLPIVFTFTALTVNNTLVYLAVRKAFLKSQVTVTERQICQRLQRREVAIQGFLYVAAFFVCVWPVVTIRFFEIFSTEDLAPGEFDTQIYWLLVVQCIFLPLQGFLNMFVYNRPNYARIRLAEPDISLFAAIRRACLDSNIPTFQEIIFTGPTPGVPPSRVAASQKNASIPACASVQKDSDEDLSVQIDSSKCNHREFKDDTKQTVEVEHTVPSIVVGEADGLSQYSSLTTESTPSGWTTKKSEKTHENLIMEKGKRLPSIPISTLESAALQTSQSDSSYELHSQ